SPTGGGVLTSYGRSLSKEVLSTWSADGEEQFAYSLVKPPEWLMLQGFYRSVYVYRNTPSFIDGRTIFMQGDLEAAAKYQGWTLDATVGYQNPAIINDGWDHVVSRRHYLMYQTESGFSVRGGRF